MATADNGGADRSTCHLEPPEDFRPGEHSDHAISLTASFLFDSRRERKIHFDDFSGSDGAFAMLVGLFLGRMDPQGVAAAARTLDFADAQLSTAVYVLRVLVEGGWVRQIGPAGNEHYTLPPRAEEAMYRYIAVNVDALREAGRRLL